MKKNMKSKIFSLVLLSGMICLVQANAASMADASAVMADIDALAVQAHANVAQAAASGDTAATEEAMKRSDAINFLVNNAQAALAQVEAALENGNEAAADEAMEDLDGTYEMSLNALQGIIPENLASGTSEDSGGAPGDPANPPNINDVPWQTDGMRSYYDGLFNQFWSASAFGGGEDFGEADATPE